MEETFFELLLYHFGFAMYILACTAATTFNYNGDLKGRIIAAIGVPFAMPIGAPFFILLFNSSEKFFPIIIAAIICNIISLCYVHSDYIKSDKYGK